MSSRREPSFIKTFYKDCVLTFQMDGDTFDVAPALRSKNEAEPTGLKLGVAIKDLVKVSLHLHIFFSIIIIV